MSIDAPTHLARALANAFGRAEQPGGFLVAAAFTDQSRKDLEDVRNAK